MLAVAAENVVVCCNALRHIHSMIMFGAVALDFEHVQVKLSLRIKFLVMLKALQDILPMAIARKQHLR